jgi:hypothetical protein
MNDMTVGMENLPNVFIDRIDLHTTQGGYRVQIKLCMYDHSPKRSWYGREDLSDLDIKVVFRGGEAADALNDGTDSLHDYSPALPAVIVMGQSAFSTEEEQGDYTKFSTIVEINIPTPSSLNVYAACFISGLDFGNDLFNKFYGPMSAEKIFVSTGAMPIINQQSGYFYYPETNEEYGGPVHQHSSTGYMEGSEHSVEQHAKLVYVEEENYKIRFPTEFEQEFGITGVLAGTLNSQSEEAGVRLASGTTGFLAGTIEADVTSQTMMEDELIENAELADYSESVALALTQRPQAQNLLASINFEVRDAIRRGIY